MVTFTNRPPMMVKGQAYDYAVMESAYASVPDLFKMADVMSAFARAGLPRENVDRAVDRFMQAKRRSKQASFSGGRWRKASRP